MHAQLLGVLGYRAVDFRSSAECLEWLANNEADLALIEPGLEGSDGIEREANLHEEGHRFPFVFTASSDDGALAREALEIGAAAVVTKPLPMELLQRTVEEALASVRADRRTMAEGLRDDPHRQRRQERTAGAWWQSAPLAAAR